MSSPFETYGPCGTALAAVVGLIVGGFVNVLVHRLPRGESVVFPSSHCPACGAPIGALDNIPVVSWLLLRGRCRVCGAPISARYPVLEIANAILWVFIFLRAREWPE